MTAIKFMFNMGDLRKGHEGLLRLEAAAIDRARIYLESQGQPRFAQFHNANGFSVNVVMGTLLNDEHEDVVFHWTDVQGKGMTHDITVPRDVLLGQPTDEEEEFREYKRLEAKFAKKFAEKNAQRG